LKPAIDAGYVLSNSGDGRLEQLTLKAFKARFSKQRRELVLRCAEHNGRATFTSDERPSAAKESVTKQFRQLLADHPPSRGRNLRQPPDGLS